METAELVSSFVSWLSFSNDPQTRVLSAGSVLVCARAVVSRNVRGYHPRNFV